MFKDVDIRNLKPKDKAYWCSDNTGQRGSGRLKIKAQKNGVKEFYFSYFMNGKERTVKLGNYRDRRGMAGLSLSEARDKRDECDRVLREGLDPKTLIEEQNAWIQHITCVKQEPPDDESEAGSPDSGFTTSSETPPSPSVFQTIESGNSGFQCPQCKKYYKTAASLRAHVNQHHSGERTCNQCQPPVTLNSAQALANHNHSYHSGERICTQCQPPVTLKSAKALADHNRCHHSGARTCNQCQPPVTLNSAHAYSGPS